MTGARIEAKLIDTNHVIVAMCEHDRPNFRAFGSVVTADELAAGRVNVARKIVYLAGDLDRLPGPPLEGAARILAIEGLSRGYEAAGVEAVGLGKVPMSVGGVGVGVYYRRFFDDGDDYFARICAEHTFQALTESAKPSKAHRTGIYLTPVMQVADELHFRLLRCSTNLSGPTEDFRTTDHRIVDALNDEAARIFCDHARINHVLAQVFANTPADSAHKQTKARISAHADKTKDMPSDGVMAFCTFYDGLNQLQPLASDPFDYGHRGQSGLARLHFRLKDGAANEAAALPVEFSLTLYANSVFFMPLSTNRLYTHEIRPSVLNAEMLPTRLGYVARCSKTEAVHKHGSTFLKLDGELVPLEPATPAGIVDLRALYVAENSTTDVVDYGDRFRFSMNEGDYQAPGRGRG